MAAGITFVNACTNCGTQGSRTPFGGVSALAVTMWTLVAGGASVGAVDTVALRNCIRE
jgi:hypothetical protein